MKPPRRSYGLESHRIDIFQNDTQASSLIPEDAGFEQQSTSLFTHSLPSCCPRAFRRCRDSLGCFRSSGLAVPFKGGPAPTGAGVGSQCEAPSFASLCVQLERTSCDCKCLRIWLRVVTKCCQFDLKPFTQLILEPRVLNIRASSRARHWRTWLSKWTMPGASLTHQPKRSCAQIPNPPSFAESEKVFRPKPSIKPTPCLQKLRHDTSMTAAHEKCSQPLTMPPPIFRDSPMKPWHVF